MHSVGISKVGLIAGNGKFPFLFVHAAKKQGMKIAAVGIRGDTHCCLPFLTDQFLWVNPGEIRKLFDFFQSAGVKKVIMAGQVSPHNLFDAKVELDEEFRNLFDALQDRKADTIFSAIADKLAHYGLELMDSTFLLKEFMAPRGTLTRRGPTMGELGDMEFGKSIAKAMGGLDVGQTVVVKDKAIVAIEAMEGTDRCILRGGKIARQGAVVVKMSKPLQDSRFDVPVIGPRTISNMRKSRSACLAIEAGRTLIIDYPLCKKIADKHKICIVSS